MLLRLSSVEIVSQGIQPKLIVILSPHKQEHSSLSGVTKIKDWPIAKVGEQKSNAIRFDTIRSFKGLEADIVFLIDIKDDDKFCSKADIYVGGSRAWFKLCVFRQALQKMLGLNRNCLKTIVNDIIKMISTIGMCKYAFWGYFR